MNAKYLSMKIIKVMLALFMGLCGGTLIYMELGMIFAPPPAWFLMLSFFGGWAICTSWLLRGSTMISETLGRGFLLGAILSFGLTPAFIILGLKAVDTRGPDAAVAGSVIGGGLVGSFGIGISMVLTFLSLVGYGLVRLYARERVGSTKVAGMLVACPICAEPIQPTAKKCRHCGEFLQSPTDTNSPEL